MTLRRVALALIGPLGQFPTASEARRSTIEQRRVGVTCIISKCSALQGEEQDSSPGPTFK